MASGANTGIMNPGPPEDSPVDVLLPLFINGRPAATSVTGVPGTVPWQLVSCLQQVEPEDKQDESGAKSRAHSSSAGAQRWSFSSHCIRNTDKLHEALNPHQLS